MFIQKVDFPSKEGKEFHLYAPPTLTLILALILTLILTLILRGEGVHVELLPKEEMCLVVIWINWLQLP